MRISLVLQRYARGMCLSPRRLYESRALARSFFSMPPMPSAFETLYVSARPFVCFPVVILTVFGSSSRKRSTMGASMFVICDHVVVPSPSHTPRT